MPVMSWQVREGARGMDGHTCVCTVKGHLELVLHVVHGRSDWRAAARAERGANQLRRVALVARATPGARACAAKRVRILHWTRVDAS